MIAHRFPVLLSLIVLTAGAHAADTADGARLYRQHCSACHGHDGTGGVGIPLALPAFLASVDDRYLGHTIRLGRPGRVMPAFAQLTDAEVDAIVQHLRHGPDRPAAASHSHRPVRGSATRGATLYARHCATCHGPDGEGAHGTGVTFSRPRSAPILAPALNNRGFLAAASDAMIKTTLMRGRAGTPMQSFLRQGLTERDINDVVAHVRSFERRPAATDAGSPIEPPILVRDSTYSLAETMDKLKTAIAAANMRLIRVQTLDQGFVTEGRENPDQTIVYSCDFAFLNEALQVDPRVGLFLPCRVTVVRNGDRVQVMAINPKRLSRVFNNVELDRLCDRMHQVYIDLLEESVL